MPETITITPKKSLAVSQFLEGLAKKTSKKSLGFEFLLLELFAWSLVSMWETAKSLIPGRK